MQQVKTSFCRDALSIVIVSFYSMANNTFS
jgi:hypothetical protein